MLTSMNERYGNTLTNLVGLGAFAVVGFVLVQGATRLSSAHVAGDAAFLVAAIASFLFAWRLRAVIAMSIVGVFVAFGAAELSIHVAYGIRVLQGAPSHWAVLTAAAIGVLLGGWAAAVRRTG